VVGQLAVPFAYAGGPSEFQSIPEFAGGPDAPGATSRATSPVGYGALPFGLTSTVTVMVVPCVVFAGTVSVKFVVVGVKVEVAVDQLAAIFATSTDPRPVAKSYAAVVLYPERTPTVSPVVLVTQFGEPVTQGIALVEPAGMS
jgi:hypothetical protein